MNTHRGLAWVAPPTKGSVGGAETWESPVARLAPAVSSFTVKDMKSRTGKNLN